MKIKSKRVLSLFISLTMIFSIICVNTFAAADSVTMDKAAYLANENMKITITGMTEDQISNGAWAGIFKATDKYSADAISWTWISDIKDTANIWSTPASNDLGDYELRVFTADPSDKNTREAVLFKKISFKVTSNTAASSNIVIQENKTDFTVSEKVNVKITGLTSGQTSNGAWAGVFKTTDKISADSISWTWISDITNTSDTWTFEAPKDFGAYEIRVFTADPSDKNTRDTVLFGKLVFNVVNSKAKDGDLTINKKAFAMSEKMLVTIEGFAEGQLADSAWAGIFRVNDKYNADAISWTWINDFRDGKTWEDLTSPSAAGEYEIRVFTKDIQPTTRRQEALFGKIPFKVFKASALINWEKSKLAYTKIPATLGVDKTVQLKVYAAAGKKKITANDQVMFSTSDSSIAVVTPSGVIKGIAPGEVTITITADGDHLIEVPLTIK